MLDDVQAVEVARRYEAGETVDELVAAHEAGSSQDELAERFGIGRSTVRRRLLQAGVTLPPRAEGIRAAKRRGWG